MSSADDWIAESQRLRLRRISPADFTFLFELFNDEQAMAYYEGLRNEAETRSWIQFVLDCYRKHGHGKWLIERKSDGVPLGHTGLIFADIDGRREVELGYFLHPRHWGQGYAVEAARCALELAWERYGYRRVICAINPRNLPSVKVAVRLGMSREKTGTASAGGESWPADIYVVER